MREPAGTPLNNSWPAVCFNLVIDKNTALLTGSKLNTDRPKMSAVPLILASVNDTCVAGLGLILALEISVNLYSFS